MRHSIRLSALVITGALTLAACGGGSSNPTVAAQPSTTSVASSAATTPTTAAAASATTTPTTGAPAVAKVSANNATQAELAAAFQAAGIPSAAQWAKEVVEYRPYPTNDPTIAKLRQNLVKYNPGPGVVDSIVAALSL
jgi:glutamate-1-semialdehyde aminotransferase